MVGEEEGLRREGVQRISLQHSMLFTSPSPSAALTLSRQCCSFHTLSQHSIFSLPLLPPLGMPLTPRFHSVRHQDTSCTGLTHQLVNHLGEYSNLQQLRQGGRKREKDSEKLTMTV